MTAKRYLHGLPRKPDHERTVNVLRIFRGVATVEDEYTESGEASYSISSGRRLKDDGKPPSVGLLAPRDAHRPRVGGRGVNLPQGCTLGPPPRQRRRHLGTKVRPDGAVSALCFKSPRAIDMKRATWTTDRSAVNCPKCLRTMRSEP